MGIFTYSHEDGTRAGAMTQQISDKVKQARREQAMSAQREVARGLNAAMIGRKIRVLTEKMANTKDLQAAQVSSWEHGHLRGGDESPKMRGRFLVARGEADAPDIDGRVYIQGDKLPIGQFAEVEVVGHTDYDLIARAS